MSSRLSDRLDALRLHGRKAAGVFLTNGYPTLESTGPLLDAIEAGGADFIELGMPFSDPLAEGPPIQLSSARALAGGVVMEDAFRTVRAFRSRSDTPVVLMGYVNPVLRFGVERFCAQARDCGVDGLIIPDLPPQEAAALAEPAGDAGLDMIYLAAPNTPNSRIRYIDTVATGFVYAVSITGLTGSGLHGRMEAIGAYLQRARQNVTANPLLAGFGIKTREDAACLSRHTDGFIVGSALVSLIESMRDSNTDTIADAVAQFVRDLRP